MKWLLLIGTLVTLPVIIFTGYIVLKLFFVSKSEYTDFDL